MFMCQLDTFVNPFNVFCSVINHSDLLTSLKVHMVKLLQESSTSQLEFSLEETKQ